MPNVDLLWVTVDPNPRCLSRRRPEERFSIHSHIQRYRKKTERLSRDEALAARSFATAILGWNSRATLKQQSVVALCSSPSVSNDSSTQKVKTDPGESQSQSQSLIPHTICGKGSAIDPFDSTALKLNSEAFDHMQFYLAWGRPIANTRQSYGLVGNMMDKQVDGLVKSCMSSKLRSHALLSFVTAMMGFLDIKHDSVQHQGTLHHQNALETLRGRVLDHSCEPRTLVYDIALLCRAATYRRDDFAALAHVYALKKIIDQIGGFQALDIMETRYILFTDHRLAYARLAPNVFTLQQQLAIVNPRNAADKVVNISDVPPRQWRADPGLDLLANGLLVKLNGLSLPESLGQIYRDIILCVQVLESTWADASSSPNNSWLTGKHLTISSCLLSMSFTEDGASSRRVHHESARTTLILWDLLILACTSKGRARNVLPEIGTATLEARKAGWPPRVYEGFQNWNRTLRAMPLHAAANDAQTLLRLVSVVRQMESDNDVQLGGFMMRLFELERAHHERKIKSGAER